MLPSHTSLGQQAELISLNGLPDPKMVLSTAPLLVSPILGTGGRSRQPSLTDVTFIQSRHPFIPQMGNRSSANSATTCRIHVGSEGQPWFCAIISLWGWGEETQELPEGEERI